MSKHGATWWSGRFLRSLERLGMTTRLRRGYNYYQEGRVLRLDVQPGVVSSVVRGSEDYDCQIYFEPLSDMEWTESLDRLALGDLSAAAVRVAVDVTEDPYWGKDGLYNTRASVHELSSESWQYVNLSVVEPCFIPLMSLPYRQIDDLDLLVLDLLEYLRSLQLRVKLLLFDRGFYHAHLIDYLENARGGRSWPYLIFVPKNKAIKGYIKRTKSVTEFAHELNYNKAKSAWKPITKIVICKGIGKDRNGKPFDWCFATNQPASVRLVWLYKKRWNIETGFRIMEEGKIKTKDLGGTNKCSEMGSAVVEKLG